MKNRKKLNTISNKRVKDGSFKKSMKKLLMFCRKYWGWLALSIILGGIGVAFQIIGPNKIADITVLIATGLRSGGIDLKAVSEIGIFLVIIYSLGAILSYFEHFILTTVTQKVSKKFRHDISHKINKLPLNYYDTHMFGDILSRVTNDVDRVGQSLNESIGNFFHNVILFLGVLVIMLVKDWVLALTVIGATIIGFALSFTFMTRAQKYFNQNQKHLGQLNAHIEEVYTGHNVVQLFNAKEDTKKQFASTNKKLLSTGWKSQFISGVMGPIMGFVGNFGYVAVIIVGAIMALNKDVTYIGRITEFMIYVRLFANPLSQLLQQQIVCLTFWKKKNCPMKVVLHKNLKTLRAM